MEFPLLVLQHMLLDEQHMLLGEQHKLQDEQHKNCRKVERKNSGASAALVGTPHHLLAQGVEILGTGTFDDFHTIGRLANSQTGGLRQVL